MKVGCPAGRLVAGVDEAGRGPLAGPVFAAAVILDARLPVAGLADSKILSGKKRSALADSIRERSLAWALGRAEVEEIDTLNILQASLLAMQRAVEALPLRAQHVVIDGNCCPRLSCSVEAIVKADAKIAAVSAASILAKVGRDLEMEALDARFPGYGFARHKGYATREHLLSLRSRGPCELHRRTFAPVTELVRERLD